MEAVQELAAHTTTRAACDALGVAPATYYRRQRPAPPRRYGPRKPSPRRIPDVERQRIRDELNSEPFMDKAPGQVVAILGEQGRCIGSERTMYRVLHEVEQVRERRERREHPKHAIPRLVARAPNEVWTWDITKLRGEQKGIYYALYLVLDLFTSPRSASRQRFHMPPSTYTRSPVMATRHPTPHGSSMTTGATHRLSTARSTIRRTTCFAATGTTGAGCTVACDRCRVRCNTT